MHVYTGDGDTLSEANHVTVALTRTVAGCLASLKFQLTSTLTNCHLLGYNDGLAKS